MFSSGELGAGKENIMANEWLTEAINKISRITPRLPIPTRSMLSPSSTLFFGITKVLSVVFAIRSSMQLNYVR